MLRKYPTTPSVKEFAQVMHLSLVTVAVLQLFTSHNPVLGFNVVKELHTLQLD